MMDDANLKSQWDALREPPSLLIARVRAEFLDMPGLRMTPAQAVRAWGLRDQMARAVLQALADARFLVRSADGSYARWSN